MTINNEMIEAYLEAKAGLKKYKALELKLRNEIIGQFRFTDHEGIQKREVELGDDTIQLKIGLKMTRKLDNEAIETIWSTLSENEKSLITFKPALNTAEYKKMLECDEVKSLAQAITEKPSQSSLEIIFPE